MTEFRLSRSGYTLHRDAGSDRPHPQADTRGEPQGHRRPARTRASADRRCPRKARMGRRAHPGRGVRATCDGRAGDPEALSGQERPARDAVPLGRALGKGGVRPEAAGLHERVLDGRRHRRLGRGRPPGRRPVKTRRRAARALQPPSPHPRGRPRRAAEAPRLEGAAHRGRGARLTGGVLPRRRGRRHPRDRRQ